MHARPGRGLDRVRVARAKSGPQALAASGLKPGPNQYRRSPRHTPPGPPRPRGWSASGRRRVERGDAGPGGAQIRVRRRRHCVGWRRNMPDAGHYRGLRLAVQIWPGFMTGGCPLAGAFAPVGRAPRRPAGLFWGTCGIGRLVKGEVLAVTAGAGWCENRIRSRGHEPPSAAPSRSGGGLRIASRAPERRLQRHRTAGQLPALTIRLADARPLGEESVDGHVLRNGVAAVPIDRLSFMAWRPGPRRSAPERPPAPAQ